MSTYNFFKYQTEWSKMVSMIQEIRWIQNTTDIIFVCELQHNAELLPRDQVWKLTSQSKHTLFLSCAEHYISNMLRILGISRYFYMVSWTIFQDNLKQLLSLIMYLIINLV